MKDQLKDQLAQLHEQLSSNPELDDESSAMLRQLAEDIEVIELTDSAEFSEGVQRLAVEFEQEHPGLSEVLRQIVDTLGRIGV